MLASLIIQIYGISHTTISLVMSPSYTMYWPFDLDKSFNLMFQFLYVKQS